jgi:cytochrome c oxidase accessory protein FixG
LIPFVKVGGNPLVLLDIPARRFTILAYTFLPTDTLLLAIFMVGALLSIFLFTALFGRVWCGWACPQTVYMEFLFRPIERLFDGTAGRGGSKSNIPAWRTATKFLVFFLLCIYLANTFLAYFIGVDTLKVWVTQSPLQHPGPFLVMAFVTFAMMVDFCYFREQMCLIACPYGRFQSVLLDRNSLIVAYDEKRGEPRGKARKSKGGAEQPVIGDCIDCGNCVTTCPTGIDIRKGLQMECINCTQCIDACNLVMEKVGRAPNLIRYSSQARDAGLSSGLLRARTLIYPVLLTSIVAAFFTVFMATKSFDAVVLREAGNPYVMTEDGNVRNLIRFKLTNRTDKLMRFTAKVIEPDDTIIVIQEPTIELTARNTYQFHASILSPTRVFSKGKADAIVEIANDEGVSRTVRFKLVGPL